MTTGQVKAVSGGALRAPLALRGAWPFLLGGLFLLGSVLVGLAVGPVHLGLGAAVESGLSHLPFVHVNSGLSPADDAILWQLRAPPSRPGAPGAARGSRRPRVRGRS